MYTALKGKISLALIAVSVCGCGGSETGKDISAKSRDVKNIGHAGCGFNYLFNPFNPLPTNSFKSLTTALEYGADGVEVDLQVTADGKLVLFHDITLDDNTGLEGFVYRAKGEDVIGTPYTNGFPYSMFHDETVIDFQKWIRYAAGLPKVPYLQVDLKTGNGLPDDMKDSLITIALRQLTEAGYPMEQVIMISQDPVIVLKLMNMNSDWDCGFETTDFASGLNWVVKNNCRYLVMEKRFLTDSAMRQARDRGIGIITFGGRSRGKLKDIVSLNPDFIQSNNVALLNELLQE